MAYDGNDKVLEEVTGKSYEFGFTTDIESDKAPAGLNEDIIRLISSKKEEPEWMLKWRLEAFAVFDNIDGNKASTVLKAIKKIVSKIRNTEKLKFKEKNKI